MMTTGFSQVIDSITSETSAVLPVVSETASPAMAIPVSGQYNIVAFEHTTDGSRLVLTKTIPGQLVERYVQTALKTVVPTQIEDGSWFADVERLDGVWARGDSPHECLVELNEVIVDWLLLKIESEDKDIPILDDINLNLIP